MRHDDVLSVRCTELTIGGRVQYERLTAKDEEDVQLVGSGRCRRRREKRRRSVRRRVMADVAASMGDIMVDDYRGRQFDHCTFEDAYPDRKSYCIVAMLWWCLRLDFEWLDWTSQEARRREEGSCGW